MGGGGGEEPHPAELVGMTPHAQHSPVLWNISQSTISSFVLWKRDRGIECENNLPEVTRLANGKTEIPFFLVLPLIIYFVLACELTPIGGRATPRGGQILPGPLELLGWGLGSHEDRVLLKPRSHLQDMLHHWATTQHSNFWLLGLER